MLIWKTEIEMINLFLYMILAKEEFCNLVGQNYLENKETK